MTLGCPPFHTMPSPVLEDAALRSLVHVRVMHVQLRVRVRVRV